ncbi:MAG: glycerate kinase [Thermodesulfobacteriota bacterium]
MNTQSKEHAIRIFKHALEAARPAGCVLEHFALDGETLTVDDKVYELKDYGSIYVIAFGKAAPAMASAVEEVLGDRIREGCVVSNTPPPRPFKKLRFYPSSHPMPDERSVNCSLEVTRILEDAQEGDLVIALISGGGSALLSLPAEGLTLEHKRKVTETLLKSGVDTHGLNVVRKHISAIKGGGLLKKALPAEVITLILSDVVGDRLDVIASGPMVPDQSSFEEAWQVIEDFRLEHRLPPQVIVHLEEGRRGGIEPNLKTGDFDPERVQTVIVGSNFKSLVAAEKKAAELGYNTLLLSSQIKGEAREVAKAMAGIALNIERFNIPVSRPACLVFGGETTVTVTGDGKGGRCMETALSFSIEIMGHVGVLGLFCGTDGIDGPTDAAGAICDGTTRIRGRKLGLSARESLLNNDSHTFFDKLGQLVRTGPTGTNVMDIGVVILR